MTRTLLVFSSALSFLMVGCSRDNADLGGETDAPASKVDERKQNFGKLFGDEFMSFGGPKKAHEGFGAAANVNPYIWRASLEALRFAPLSAADSSGGVIVTDWYSTPSAPHERIKIIVYVTSYLLRADSIHVDIFKQVKTKASDWVPTTIDHQMKVSLEDIILTKARELRIEAKKKA